jgi:hypothetical protein
MADDINLRRTSGFTFEATDIVIRESSTTRLILRPVVVDNHKNAHDSVKCWIVAQRKGPNERWEEVNELPLSKLHKGEWSKLELKTEDVSKILGALDAIKEQYKKHGLFFGGKYSLIKGEEAKLLAELAKFDRDVLIEKLKNINPEHLENLSETIKLSRLERLITEIRTNAKNPDEEYWQKLFEGEAWLLSQIFSQPVVVLKDKPYLGGKGIENKGGQYSDLLVQNLITRNTAIVEIKTPSTKLLGSKYRSTYSMDSELTGSVNQLLKQRQEYLNEYFALKAKSSADFIAVNPKCVLVAGTLNFKSDAEKMHAFEGFRNTLKDVELVTYSELYNKLVAFRDLLKE